MSDTMPYDEFECGCGQPTCRGHISGNDWQKPELQKRYAGFFSPHVQRKIDAHHAEKRAFEQARRLTNAPQYTAAISLYE
jgi:hypothetical protein